jgi:hypothetical protein
MKNENKKYENKIIQNFNNLIISLNEYNNFVENKIQQKNIYFENFENTFININIKIDNLIFLRNTKYNLFPITIDEINKLNKNQLIFYDEKKHKIKNIKL